MKRSHLRRRLKALEKQVMCLGPIVLFMPDGSRKAVRGDERDLLSRALRDDRTPEIELIAQSVRSTEPGGGQMIDLARALLNTPTETSESSAQTGPVPNHQSS